MRNVLLLVMLVVAVCSLTQGQPVNWYIISEVPDVSSQVRGSLGGLALDSTGNLYVSDADYGDRVLKVTPARQISIVAGTGNPGFNGDNRPAASAQLNSPRGLAVDSAGNLYIADYRNHRVRKVTPAGVITTVAGTGNYGTGGDGGPATGADLNGPKGVALDGAGNLYILVSIQYYRTDPRVRKVSPAGVITSVTNIPTGDFDHITADTGGNLYLTQSDSGKVYKVSASGGFTVLAGTGSDRFNGDGQAATSANLSPLSAGVDSAGNLYIADYGNSRIRKVTSNGLISTIAGTGESGDIADGDPAPWSPLNGPKGVALDNAGNLYVTVSPSRYGSTKTVVKLMPLQISPKGVVNAASYLTGPVAPGEIIAMFGSGLGSLNGVGTTLDPTGLVSNSVAGRKLLFDGQPSPLFYVRADQINAVVPYSVAGKASTEVQLDCKGAKSNSVTLSVASVAPGIFTADSSGKGLGAILNQDGSLNSSSKPAQAGSIVIIYATGQGQTNPPGIDGKLATAPYPQPVLPVSLTIGGIPAEILYAGAAPGFAGLMQINARLPAGVTPGNSVPVVLSIGGNPSQPGVTLAVQ